MRARYLADALRRLGWETELWVPGLLSLPFNIESLVSAPWWLLRALGRKPRLAVAIKPYPNTVGPLTWWQARGSHCVVDIDDLDGEYRGGFAAALVRQAQAPALRTVKYFSTHHPAIRQQLKKTFPAKAVALLGQGVDLSVFNLVSGQEVKKVLGFTAHLNIACQLDVLFDWIQDFLRQDQGWRLRIIGGGPAEAHFRAEAAHRGLQEWVEFTGLVPPEAIPKLLADTSACLAPYPPSSGNQYRVPMKVGEYLALGKKVITNRIEGLLPLEKFVYTAEPNSKDFIKVLNEALLSSDGREQQGRIWVREHLDWTAVAQRFLNESFI